MYVFYTHVRMPMRTCVYTSIYIRISLHIHRYLPVILRTVAPYLRMHSSVVKNTMVLFTTLSGSKSFGFRRNIDVTHMRYGQQSSSYADKASF